MANNLTTQSREEIIRFIDEANDKLWRLRGVADFNATVLMENLWEKINNIDYPYGRARCLHNTAMGVFIIQHNNVLALQQLNEALSILKEIGNKKWSANVHCTLGIIHNSIGNSESAITNALRAVDYYENHKEDKTDRLMVYYTVGTVYKDLKKYEEAENYFLKGITNEVEDDITWSGRIYSGLANVYTILEKYDEALRCSLIALEKLRSEKNTVGESRSLTDTGVIYKKLGDFSTALDYLMQGLQIRESIKTHSFIVSSHMEIADLYNDMGNFEKAILHLEKGKEIAIEINQELKLAKIYPALAKVNKSLNNFSKAFFYLEQLIELNTNIAKNEADSRIQNLQTTLVKEKEEEIERLKNVELKNAYTLISEKNKEITDSINYARRIQQGILPSNEELKLCFEDHFVFYKPKDIVSGDFYWCRKVIMENEDVDVNIIAAVDCTGHGVPGAFMSMLGQTLLNQTIKVGEVTSPADALNYLNNELPNNLKSQDKQSSIRDGMDIALCGFELISKKLLYAGANNPIWILRNKEIIELLPDKQAITASNDSTKKSFTNKSFSLIQNDIVYLFTDGYADQFGGPKGKKFKYKNLQKLLIHIGHLPMNKQAIELDIEFEKWRGNNEQVDDVLIIGIKIN